jgi:hypothetical protein
MSDDRKYPDAIEYSLTHRHVFDPSPADQEQQNGCCEGKRRQ